MKKISPFTPKQSAYSMSEALIALSLIGIMALISISVLHNTDNNALAATAKLNKVDSAMKSFDMALRKTNETGLGIQSKITNQNTLSEQVQANFLHNTVDEDIVVDIDEEAFANGAKLGLANGTELSYAYDDKHVLMEHNGKAQPRLGAMYATVEYRGETYGREYTIFPDGIFANGDVQIVCESPRKRTANGKSCVCSNGGDYNESTNTCNCSGNNVEQNGICAPCPGDLTKVGNACACANPDAHQVDNNCKVCSCPTPSWDADSQSCVACSDPRNNCVDNQCTCPEGTLLDAACTVCQNGAQPNADRNACVCSGGRQYIDNECKCTTAPKTFWDGNACTCPAETLLDDNCTHCPADATMSENRSTCNCNDSSKKYDKTSNSCICDTSKGYVPDGAGCKLCDSTKGWKVNSAGTGCECAKENTYIDGDKCVECFGTSIADNEKKECVCPHKGEEYNDGKCECHKDENPDLQGHWNGKECVTCNNSQDHLVWDGTQTACVCDNAGGYYGSAGSCQKCEHPRKIDNNACTCKAREEIINDLAVNEIYATGEQACKSTCSGNHVANDGHTSCVCESGYNENNDGVCVTCTGIKNSEWNPAKKMCDCKTGYEWKGDVCVEEPKTDSDCDKKYPKDENGKMTYIPISTAEELALVGSDKTINGIKYANNATYCQTKDIDLSGFDTDDNADNGNWAPLPQFKGTYDGNDKKISNMYINLPEQENLGLFSSIYKGNIKSVNIEDAQIIGLARIGIISGTINNNSKVINSNSSGSIEAVTHAGGIAGSVYSDGNLFENNSSNVNIITKSPKISGKKVSGATEYYAHAGGILGFLRGKNNKIKNCSATGNITGYGYGIGGLVGFARDKFEIHDSNATVQVKGFYYVGGLVGLVHDTFVIDNCYSTGNVTVLSSDEPKKQSGAVGGLIGSIGNIDRGEDSIAVSNSYSKGNISFEDKDVKVTSGGLIGSIGSTGSAKITNCYASGNVFGYVAGGLIGSMSKDIITDSYATGKVEGTQNVGGLVGSNDSGTIENSHADGAVTGTSKVGGLVGQIDTRTEITNSYAIGAVTGTSQVGGLVGYARSGSITDSHATGNITGAGEVKDQRDFGGLVGDNNAKIKNSYATGNISTAGFYVGGLCGYSYDSATITDSYATGKVESTGHHVGGLVGAGYSTTDNCYATGDVSGSYDIGGFVGTNYGVIKNSHASGKVTGDSIVGGFVGDNYTNSRQEVKIENCYATGKVYALSGNYAGGFAATSYSPIDNCYATGDVISTGTGCVAGFVAFTSKTTIFNSYYQGSVTASVDYESTGGFVGDNSQSTITNSFAIADVIGGKVVGGFVGKNSTYALISDCYAQGTVTGDTDVGGFVANNLNQITNSYTSAIVTGNARTGAFAYNNNIGKTSIISSSFYDNEKANVEKGVYTGSADGVTGLTTAEMKNTKNFIDAGWDDGDNKDIWYFDCGNYPLLRNMPAGAPAVGDKNNLCKAQENPAKTTCEDKDNPNLIYIETAQQLALVASDKTVDGIKYAANGSYCQIADIDLSGFDTDDNADNGNWTPLPHFSGTYDGNEKKISNMYINLPEQEKLGLFSEIYHANIERVNVEDAQIIGLVRIGIISGIINNNSKVINSNSSGSIEALTAYAGGIAGMVGSGGNLFENNSSNVNIITKSPKISGKHVSSTSDYLAPTGGIFGSLSGRNNVIKNCSATGNITGYGYGIGGLVGFARDEFEIHASNATVQVKGFSSVGGLVGRAGDTFVIDNCYSTGNITVLSSDEPKKQSGDVGGLIGFIYYIDRGENSITVSNSYSKGNISFENNVVNVISGGLIGAISSTGSAKITNCYASGNVFGIRAGGLIGSVSKDIITDSYASGNVFGHMAGGLIGDVSEGIITDSYATGAVTGSGSVGGLVGNNDSGTITNSYATGAVTGTYKIGGFVGTSVEGTISDSYSSGDVTVENQKLYENSSVGGFAGYTKGGVFDKCYSSSKVSLTSMNYKSNVYVGGFIGENYSKASINNAYSTGDVDVFADDVASLYAGGFAGFNSKESSITSAFATGKVLVTGDKISNYDVAGFAGNNWSKATINNSYNKNTIMVTFTGNHVNTGIGGFVGNDSATVNNSYAVASITTVNEREKDNIYNFAGFNNGANGVGLFFDSDVATKEKAAIYTENYSVTGLPTAEMHNTKNFIDAGWNTTIWELVQGQYPKLKNVGGQ